MNFFKYFSRVFQDKADSQKRPIVLISSAIDYYRSGDYIYNGGVKLYNLWSKLLRSRGFLTYIVTYDGKYQHWLAEHFPHISIDIVKKWLIGGENLRFVSCWLDATVFVNLAPKLYYHDCEPAYSFNAHFPILKRLLRKNRIILSCETRAEQAYYRSRLGLDTHLIPPYNDPQYFFANSQKRKANLIGFVEEGKDTLKQIELIKDYLRKRKIRAKFVKASGGEEKFTQILRTCDLFLGMNPGKDKFHNEGLARTQFEAMQCGAVVVAFDVGGNREFLFDGYNGRLMPSRDIDLMVKVVESLLSDSKTKEYLRHNGISFSKQAFTPERTWPTLKQFLYLENFEDQDFSPNQFDHVLNKQELTLFLGAPAYLHEDELFLFKKYAALTKNTIVEIGAGYGASALLFLLYKKPGLKVYSIDKFTMEEKTRPPKGGEAPPSAKQCEENIRQALEITQRGGRLSDWQLVVGHSAAVSSEWNKKIGLLFIDGDHSYKGVNRDFESWFPHVEKGGIIFLHDSRRLPRSPRDKFSRGWQGPTKLAHQLAKRKNVRIVDQAFSLTVWQKI